MNSKELTGKLKELLDIIYVQQFNKEGWSYNRKRIKCHTTINNVSKKKKDEDGIPHSDVVLHFCTRNSDLFKIFITNFVDEPLDGMFKITSLLVIEELDEELDEISSSVIEDSIWDIFICPSREYVIEKLLQKIQLSNKISI